MIMECPDITGFCLKEAVSVLEEKGFRLGNVRLTAPPGADREIIADRARVIRIEGCSDGQVDILVCNIK